VVTVFAVPRASDKPEQPEQRTNTKLNPAYPVYPQDVAAVEGGRFVAPIRNGASGADAARGHDVHPRDGFTIGRLQCARGGHVGRLHPTDAVCKECDPKLALSADSTEAPS
jgi:hypothetical protein